MCNIWTTCIATRIENLLRKVIYVTKIWILNLPIKSSCTISDITYTVPSFLRTLINTALAYSGELSFFATVRCATTGLVGKREYVFKGQRTKKCISRCFTRKQRRWSGLRQNNANKLRALPFAIADVRPAGSIGRDELLMMRISWQIFERVGVVVARKKRIKPSELDSSERARTKQRTPCDTVFPHTRQRMYVCTAFRLAFVETITVNILVFDPLTIPSRSKRRFYLLSSTLRAARNSEQFSRVEADGETGRANIVKQTGGNNW